MAYLIKLPSVAADASGGVLHQWLRKIRRSDAAEAAVAPAAPPPLRILHLRPAEFLGLVVFWAAIFALW